MIGSVFLTITTTNYMDDVFTCVLVVGLSVPQQTSQPRIDPAHFGVDPD